MDKAKLDELRRREPEHRNWEYNVAAVCMDPEERDALFAYIDELEAFRDAIWKANKESEVWPGLVALLNRDTL